MLAIKQSLKGAEQMKSPGPVKLFRRQLAEKEREIEQRQKGQSAAA
jgi:hypothetical protein